MANCICGNSIPPHRRKHCSNECVKRAWYIKNTKNEHSFFKNDPLFWDTETGKGLKWEMWAAEKLGARHLMFNYGGCDLDWNGKKVDVKMCELYKRKTQRGRKTKNTHGWWVFNRNKPKDCDYFFCVCLTGGAFVKSYLIPSDEFPRVGAVIGAVSKFDKYLYP